MGGGQLSLEMGPTCELRLPARPCVLSRAGVLITVKGILVYCQQSCLTGEL